MEALNYRAILYAPDGDWVMDYESPTVEEVEEKLANQGSRWYFYPFHAVIVNKGYTPGYILRRQRLISVAPPFEEFQGRTVQTFKRHLQSLPESELEAILNG